MLDFMRGQLVFYYASCFHGDFETEHERDINYYSIYGRRRKRKKWMLLKL